MLPVITQRFHLVCWKLFNDSKMLVIVLFVFVTHVAYASCFSLGSVCYAFFYHRITNKSYFHMHSSDVILTTSLLRWAQFGRCAVVRVTAVNGQQRHEASLNTCVPTTQRCQSASFWSTSTCAPRAQAIINSVWKCGCGTQASTCALIYLGSVV